MHLSNPHKLWMEDAILRERKEDLLRIAILGHEVNDQVWGGYTEQREIEEDLDEMYESAENGEGVFLGASFSETPDGSIQDILSFIVAFEIPSTLEAVRADEDTVEALESVGLTPETAVKLLNGRRVVYVANYSRLPTDKAKRENAEMFKAVLLYALENDFVVSARCKVDTSYKVLKRFESKGVLNILFDLETDSSLYRHIVLEVSQGNFAVRFFRKYLLWARLLKAIGKGFVVRALAPIRQRRLP